MLFGRVYRMSQKRRPLESGVIRRGAQAAVDHPDLRFWPWQALGLLPSRALSSSQANNRRSQNALRKIY